MKTLMIAAAVALSLPFVDQIWQIYVLIFVLQAASAAFTPTFQATIPDVLPDESDYTKALSLSRLAYDMESFVSPTLSIKSINPSFCMTRAGSNANFTRFG